MEGFVNRIIEGDCLDILPKLATHSIDMVLCDLPYAMTQNSWDKGIDLGRLWEQYRRILKPNGVIALTGQHRFTGMLINSNPDWSKYKIVWIKSKAGNFLNANKQPLRRHEDICIFYNKQPAYMPQKTEGLPYDKGVRKDNQSGSYGGFRTASIINVDGGRFPFDILFYEEEPLTDWVYCKTAESEGAFHPTQKPVALGRWLIRSYVPSGSIILDNACGSGSFLVAAVLEACQFIGIEKNDNPTHMGRPVDFVATARARIEEAKRLMKNN